MSAGRIGRSWRWAIAAALAAGLSCISTSAGAQSFPGLSLATPGPSGSSALDALYNTAPIVLDGVTLFRIVVPVAATDQQPIAARANAVNVALDQILATTDREGGAERTIFDPATLHVESVHEDGQIVLAAVDATHHDGIAIVTVTTADAEYRQTNPDTLAAQWQAVLQGALVRALDIRQPEIQRRNVNSVTGVAAVLAAFTIAVFAVGAWFSRRIAALSTSLAASGAAVEAERSSEADGDDPKEHVERNRRLVGLLIGGLDPQKKITLYRALRLIGIALVVLGWFIGVTWATLQFPQSASFGHVMMRNGLSVAIIWIGALLIDRCLTIAVDRLPTLWELRAFGTPEDQQRQLLRAPTIARALTGLKSFVLVFVAGLATMTQLGIPVGSVVTIGGVAAIAVSLAAQNLIRDVVSGFLVLIEDQYVVGDYVTINGNRGMVERLTLRMVQIRDATGSLVTIAHSSATQVINHSRNWSRVDYEISIDPASNVAFAMAVVQQQIADLEGDADWKDAIVEPAEWIGIDALSRDGAIIRARIKTAPLRQFALRRELNARVAKAFAAAKIGYGAPAPPGL